MHQLDIIAEKLVLIIFAVMMLPFTTGCEFKQFDHKRAEVSHLRMIGLAAETYKITYERYPKSILAPEFKEYLDGESTDDEWGTEVKYQLTEDGYVVVSAGPDKKHGTADDMRLTSEHVGNWNKTAIREITNG